MHSLVVADRSGATCAACGGMVLVSRVLSFRLPGTVLSVPGSAVIDDGARAIVYVERGLGMFNATVVRLGPRCGESFPVVSGLEPGDRVASQGAFLIDAETRLTSDLAAAYFGSGGGARSSPKSALEPDWLLGLATADRPLALKQQLCPVTGKPLGSMGVPVKVGVRGRIVFLCCDNCASAIESSPDKYLAKLPPINGEGHP